MYHWRSPFIKKRVQELASQGLTSSQISQRLGLSQSRVGQIAKEDGFTLYRDVWGLSKRLRLMRKRRISLETISDSSGQILTETEG